MLEALRALDGEPARPCPRTSTSSATGSSTASTSPNPYALELPDALLRAIRAAVAESARRRRRTSRAGSPTFATKVPEEHRGEFDELLEEARLIYRIRDERGVFSDIWASGIMRRAVLAAGRRLAAKGRIHDAGAFRRCRLRRDARAAVGRDGGRPRTSSPSAFDVPRVAHAPRKPRRRWARRRRLRPTCPGCRRRPRG